MSGWLSTYTWRCDPVDFSSNPEALRVSGDGGQVLSNLGLGAVWMCPVLMSQLERLLAVLRLP